jgi:hypothetical protein
METIKILGTDDTPSVILDKKANVFEFAGRSMPEDSGLFYEPIIEWFEDYSLNPNPETIISFKLIYFNTASSKLILDVLTKLEEIHETGNPVLVKWYYPEDDEDMQEAGEEYSDILDLPFEHISYVL